MAGRGRLKAAVYVQDPTTREELILRPGDCPDPEVAVLITHPDAWEVSPDDCEEPDGPVPVEKTEPSGEDDGQEGTAGAGGTKKSQSRRSRSSGS
ncbi:hypothetical protein [Streptomyces violaceusniger]|uniref:hypothetical protein n=1 Tax=Streptomyces violaceusniger TaxID=68280 RepID=UPI003829F079